MKRIKSRFSARAIMTVLFALVFMLALSGGTIFAVTVDANNDGSVNINDVTAIQRHAAEMEPLEGICLLAADVNGENGVEINDATTIQTYLAEYEQQYPIGEKLSVLTR